MRVGVDVGGTFTDLVVFNEDSGDLRALKVLSTPKEPWRGVLAAIMGAAEPSRVTIIVHATTLGANMLLGQAGLEPPSMLLLTNKGFRDILEIGRQNRPELYNLFFEKPKPLIPRERRVGVRGRIGPRGEIIEGLDKDEIRETARKWCGHVKVFVVSFLNSHVNPVHETEAERLIREACPGSIVVTGSSVDPQEKEYERTSTAVVNAALKPLLSRYLERLHLDLKREGFRGSLLLMQSNGGIASLGQAIERPAAFIESGPAAGALAVSYFARIHGVARALGFDMGGTTAKASSIVGGEPLVVDEYEVGARIHMGRVLRGSGYTVRYPHIDVVEVSAGGGTIAWVDPGGSLRVGPVSAGADPGPACYGRGGEKPTITDANLVLGRLPEKIAGGSIRLRRDLALRALKALAEKIGVDVFEAAWSVVRVANTVMARALKLVTFERGHDAREFKLYAFGGAGPMHAAELAEELGISEIIVPPYPGVFSSLGLLLADYRHDFYKAVEASATDPSTEEKVNKVIEELSGKAVETLRSEGIGMERSRIVAALDMRYEGQSHTLKVAYNGSLSEAARRFEELHETRYGYRLPGEDVIVVNARVTAFGVTGKPRLPRSKPAGPLHPRPSSRREAFFPRDGWVPALVYERPKLRPGSLVTGPSIIEDSDSTIVIPPGHTARVAEDYSIWVRRG